MSISAVLIVKNEEKKLKACLESLSFCDEIVVVDSGSSDATVDLAKQFTKKVYSRDFDDFASQKNYAISLSESEWILSVDADEIVSNDLQEEIKSIAISGSFQAYKVLRRNILFGKWLRFGGCGNDYPIRLFKKNSAQYYGIVHEVLEVKGEVGICKKGCLLHYSTQSAKDYFKKLNHYTSLEAEILLEKGEKSSNSKIWGRPFLRFLYQYVFQLGFLDGKQGFIYSFLSSYYEFVRYSKLSSHLLRVSDKINV